MSATKRDCDASALRTFYESDLWKRMCKSIEERAGGLDELILARTGRHIPGEIVHHIYPASAYPSMRLLPKNLILVSKETHERIHAIYRQGLGAMHEVSKKLFRITLQASDDSVEWYYKALDAEAAQKGRRKHSAYLKI